MATPGGTGGTLLRFSPVLLAIHGPGQGVFISELSGGRGGSGSRSLWDSLALTPVATRHPRCTPLDAMEVSQHPRSY